VLNACDCFLRQKMLHVEGAVRGARCRATSVQVASHSTRALVQTLRGTQVTVAVDCGVLGNEFLVNDSSNVEDNDQRRPEARFLESNLVLPG
jgi:cytoskeletal protein CcmA (bactofilin family)